MAAFLQKRPDVLLQLVSGVVRSDGNPHSPDDTAQAMAPIRSPEMASDDVELLRDGFERLAAEGFEAMVPLVHPEFVMETPADLAAEPQRYEGVEGFRRWWTSFLEVMDEVMLEPQSFQETGPGQVAIEARMRAVGGASGIEATQNVVLVASIRDGKMARIDFAHSLDEALGGGRP